jgi:hypothetical protein
MIRPHYRHRNFHSNKTRMTTMFYYYHPILMSHWIRLVLHQKHLRFEIITAVTIKNTVLVCKAMQSDRLSLVSYPDVWGCRFLWKINKFLPCYMVTTQHSILTNHPYWPSLVPHALISMTYQMQMWSYYLATFCMCLWWQAFKLKITKFVIST